jgi:predicted GNAT family N-acyltransferase
LKLEYKTITYGSAEYEAEIDLRTRVLREPLGLEFTDEQLAEEANQIHLGAYLNGDLVACLVFVIVNDTTLKMRQVAVEPEMQRQGIGLKLVSYSEYYAIENGYCRIELHARDVALQFYIDSGYDIEGDEFIEVGIPHHKMVKDWCAPIGH